MAICKDCRDLAGKSKQAFTELERIHLLAAATSMHNVITSSTSRSSEMDRKVNNSVITKLLLSIEPAKRETLLQGFQLHAGLRINSNSCPHATLEVVS